MMDKSPGTMRGGEKRVSEPPIPPSSRLKLAFPRLYCIVDRACFSSNDPLNEILAFVQQVVAGGGTLFQYRNKIGAAREILSHARELQRLIAGYENTNHGEAPKLIMNDRPDLAIAARFDGVHLGQTDLSPAAARRVVQTGSIGVSTHNLEQVRAADASDCDYIAVGPVFATSSKRNSDPVIGLEGVRSARTATRKPLVAIGGITRGNCRDVIAAGADSVAVISDLLRQPQLAATEFLSLLS